MRDQLIPLNEWRGTFRGTFERYGLKKGNKVTVLLKNIVFMDTQELVTDHIWMNDTLGMQNLTLQKLEKGQIVEFDARVQKYRKGSIARNIPVSYDFKLTRPTQWKLVSSIQQMSMLLNMLTKKV